MRFRSADLQPVVMAGRRGRMCCLLGWDMGKVSSTSGEMSAVKTLIQQVRQQVSDEVPEQLLEAHFRRMPGHYFDQYSVNQIARHLRLLARVKPPDTLVAVEGRVLGPRQFEFLVAGTDAKGVLACISTAISAMGLDLQDIRLATWLPEESADPSGALPALFVDQVWVTAPQVTTSVGEMTEVLERRLQRAFDHLSRGNLVAAEEAAAESSFHLPRSEPVQVPKIGRVSAGEVLGGDFRLDERLGGGGMGEVYRATQLSLQRAVAIKLVQSEPGTQPELLTRFHREAATLASLQSPHIVAVYASGNLMLQESKRLHWLAMEYMAGGDLGYWLAKYGKPALDVALYWLRQALQGLDYAHRHGIVHRDVKPQNLFLNAEGDVKVGDFGLVKLSVAPQHPSVTLQGTILGTPYYMSPEQALGESPDERSDLYSLGATFYELLSGRRPFDESTYAAVLVKLTQHPPPPLRSLAPDVPPALEGIISRLMAREPDRRYQEARVALEDLRSYERRGLLVPADRGPPMHSRSAANTAPRGPVETMVVRRDSTQ